MPSTEITEATYRSRIAMLQDAMRQMRLQAMVLEPGAAMTYLTGVRWGRSERTFAVALPAKGEPAWVLPGFEEERARELIHIGDDIRVWQEDQSPYERIVGAMNDRGIVSGRVGIEDSIRFFVFDGIRKLAPKLEFVSAQPLLKAAGVELTATPRPR